MALADVMAALYTANGIQAALLHRERTGDALHIEVPLMEVALAGLVNVGAGALMTGNAPERLGNAHPQIVPYQTFPCSDGEAAIGVGSDRQFEVLALWAGIDLEAEPAWRTNRGRVRDRDRLVRVLEAHFRRRTVEEATAFCDANAIPASRVRSVDDVLFRQAGPGPPADPDALRRRRRQDGAGAGHPGPLQRRARLQRPAPGPLD